MPIVEQNISCKDAAAELAERFKWDDWFRGTYPKKEDDGQEVIYFKYKGRNPEKHKLYQFHGYPVLMREVIATVHSIQQEECKKAK